MTPQEKALKIEQLIESLLPDFRPVILEIEAKPQTTQNHYGEYLTLLTGLEKADIFTPGKPSADKAGERRLIGDILIKAGANPQGVNDALRMF